MSNEVTAFDVPEDFEYVSLSEIDPNAKPIAEAMYNTRVQSIKTVDYVTKNGKNAGKPGRRYEFRLQVTEDGPARGRVVFDSLFHGEGAFRALRRLMDATGIPQDNGEPLSEYLTRVAAEQPEVKYKITVKTEKDRDGNDVAKNRVDFYSATIAG